MKLRYRIVNGFLLVVVVALGAMAARSKRYQKRFSVDTYADRFSVSA
jgi:hypothetical protein